jgi:hypothetical protein
MKNEVFIIRGSVHEMEFISNKNSGQEWPGDVSRDRIIAEIMERAEQISREKGETGILPFSNWLQAEREIREKHGLPPRSGIDPRESADAG